MKTQIRYLVLVVTLLALWGQVALTEQATPDANCPGSLSFNADRISVQTCWSRRWSGLVSRQCMGQRGQSCGALALARIAAGRPVELSAEELKGGKNPGSVLCSRIGGQVVLAKGPRGDETTFCRARDKSMIDCNALMNAYVGRGLTRQ